jgi:3-hydroxyisobutyrate dehydrogenase-like beta-hydroxyacid dehydrogenase
MAKKRTKVGFVGLGLMGAPMALNIVKAGFPLTVWNRTPDKAEPVAAAGAARASTPALAARGADFILVMVADDPALDSVVFGDEGLARGMKRGATLVNCSTTSPGIGFRAATALRSLGVHYLEAPVMGSVQAAREGKLQLLVGGSRDDFEKARPILAVLGKDLHYIGEIGKGSTMKLACNLLVGAMLQGFAEFFVLSRKAGVPFETLMEVLHAGPLESQIFRSTEQAIVNAGGRPNFFLKHMLKDMNLVGDLARQLDVPVPQVSAVRQILAAAKNLGRGDDDYTAILELMATWSAVPLRG